MCKFLSAIVLKNGDIICDPEHTDSHSDLVAAFNLRDDNQHIDRFVKVEFTPPINAENLPNYSDFANYDFRVDERGEPYWFGEVRERAIEKLRDRVARMIVTESRPMLLGGCWIIGGHAQIARLNSGRVVSLSDRAKIGDVYGTAQIGNVYGAAKIGDVYDRAKISDVYGTAQIGNVYGAAQIDHVFDRAKISDVYGAAQIVTDHRIKPAPVVAKPKRKAAKKSI